MSSCSGCECGGEERTSSAIRKKAKKQEAISCFRGCSRLRRLNNSGGVQHSIFCFVINAFDVSVKKPEKRGELRWRAITVNTCSRVSPTYLEREQWAWIPAGYRVGILDSERPATGYPSRICFRLYFHLAFRLYGEIDGAIEKGPVSAVPARSSPCRRVK